MAMQNSALKWSADHRDHHRYVDKDWDPYSIKRGGLWAHVLWLFYREPDERTYENAPDLQANRLVSWQYRWNNWIGIVAGLGIPTLVGALFGRSMGGLLWGGFLRIVVIHHTTFLVNSVAHLYGTRPYTEENSARDNGLLAFITNGEGYHNFHHKFRRTSATALRGTQWDPTKWFIRRSTSPGWPATWAHAETRDQSLLRMKISRGRGASATCPRRLRRSGPPPDRARRLDRAVVLWHEADAKRRELVERGRAASAELVRSWKQSRRESRSSVQAARREWRAAARMLSSLPEEA
jgi:stearoyl-CoA desaturase (delta-9 desaturase)